LLSLLRHVDIIAGHKDAAIMAVPYASISSVWFWIVIITAAAMIRCCRQRLLFLYYCSVL